ncbi:helix-turn-helix domain-containing protein [Arthrobacter castelli]|uniref:helix-turn-helix domain-containing protein n=1 Tax=Arthrobacter castelli TaxID=271431 RepID=UPI000479745D|nr:helix-turn-helix transcriptional regulator [Arthrobacter castelli]
MPAKYENRTLEAERGLASTIARLRTDVAKLTYEELAERMRAVGCDIHASGIQKTEKSGRRITVDELIGYSRALEVPVDSLLDSGNLTTTTREFLRDLIAAENFQLLLSFTRRTYEDMVKRIREEAAKNPELRRHIEDRLKKYTAMEEPKARAMAEQDDVDISTDEKFQKYLWEWWPNSPMITTRDVLREEDDGK